MTAARDELAQIIRKAGWDAQDSPDYEKCGFDSDLFIADAILAAGWRAPKQHVHDWHRTANYIWCPCGATAKQHSGVWVITDPPAPPPQPPRSTA